MGGQHWANERRHGVLRLADREADRRLAGRQVAEEFAQPDEGGAALLGPRRRGGERSEMVMGRGLKRPGAAPRKGAVRTEARPIGETS